MAKQPFTGSLRPGTKLGKYEIGEQIAAGGMAVIYKAYDPTLDRSVAIKQIAPHLAQDERFLERFRVEAQTLAKLSSTQANIVNVHELIQQDGQLYLVMEYVEGTTLRALMDRGPVPLQTALGILLSTALGLRAMHKHGIVHRDLTPANIMLAKDGALKITDFGLIGHSGGKTSLPMGTTKYMAPEMFTGAPVDGRADLYSLGFIAYEMLAGPEKFAEVFRDVLRDDRAQQVRWMHWHSNPALVAPPLKDLQPGIPPLVSKLVERMMEKDPSKRFASAEQVIKWLRRIFVMHVQGKSLTQADSATLEREIEADAGASSAAGAGVGGPPAVARPGAAAAAAAGAGGAVQPAAGEGTVEKTAPLPQPKWTWKRAAFWAAVVGGPLIAAAAGLLIWSAHKTALREAEAKARWVQAMQAWDEKRYEDAMNAFKRIAIEFQDLPGRALEATKYAWMARAEHFLQAKDWDTAAEAAKRAEDQHLAPARWAEGFWERFNKAKEVEQTLKEVETAAAAGDYDDAIGLLSNLQAKYPELDLNDQIARYREKKELVQYNQLLAKAKEHLTARDYNAAQVEAERAREIRDTPEVKELLDTIKLEKTLDQLVRLASEAEKSGDWAQAAILWGRVLDLRPSDQVRAKVNRAKAEALVAQARKLVDNGLMKEAVEKCTEVLKYAPDHPFALQVLAKAGRQQQLDNLVAAGDKAMKAGQWQEALNSYTQALEKVDPKLEADLKKRLEAQVLEAKYQMAMVRGREALRQKEFDVAERLFREAQGLKDSGEVQALLKETDVLRQYYQGLAIGKQLLSQLNYPKALEEFERVQRIRDTSEVRDLITETNYRMHFSKAKSYFQDRRLKQALAMAKIAQRYRDTAEVQGFIALVQQLMAKEEASGG